jgi:hypothetical protein
MFPLSIHLAGDFFSHYAVLRFLIDYQKEFVPLSLPKMCGGNPGVQEGSVSDLILQAGAGSSISDSECRWWGQRSGSKSFTFGITDHLSLLK